MFTPLSRRSPQPTSIRNENLTVRLVQADDEPAIRQAAALDGKKAPEGRVLVAEHEGRIIAAVPLDSGQVIADPFYWTSDVVSLLELRAERLTRAELAVRAAPRAARMLQARMT